jgi:hypothetical protein
MQHQQIAPLTTEQCALFLRSGAQVSSKDRLKQYASFNLSEIFKKNNVPSTIFLCSLLCQQKFSASIASVFPIYAGQLPVPFVPVRSAVLDDLSAHLNSQRNLAIRAARMGAEDAAAQKLAVAMGLGAFIKQQLGKAFAPPAGDGTA